jgi:ribonuclease HI
VPPNGPGVTNDYCEVNSLCLGLAAVKCSGDPGASVIEVIGDSQLLINHFTGSTVIRNPNLAVEIAEINRIFRGFNGVHWQHVKRNFNKAADSLANIAIDAKSSGRLVGNANQFLAQRRDEVLKLLALVHTYYNRSRKPVLLGRLIDFRES